jgi:hypothetical protein
MGIVWFLPFYRLIFVFVGPMQQALFGLCFPFFTIIRVGPRLHVTTTRMMCLIGMKFNKASVIFLYESACILESCLQHIAGGAMETLKDIFQRQNKAGKLYFLNLYSL